MLRKFSRAMSGVAVFIAMLMAFSTAQARTLDEIISDGTVRIGVHPNIPPLSFRDQDGNWQGWDIEMGKLLADKIGAEVEFVPVEWKARVPSLISDQIDFSMAALTRNSKRAKVIDFTVPIHTENLAVLTTDKVGKISSWKDLDKKGLTMVGCRGCFPVNWMKTNMPNVKVLIVDSGSDMVRTIAQGRADGMVANLEWHKRFTENFKDVNWVIIDDVIRTSYCAIGVAKGNSSLRDFLNLALYEIQSTGKHNEIWESFWGMPPLVKIEADPYF